jgi:hypothetical protein
MKEATVPVTASMPPELDLRARICAAKMKVSRAELVRLALVDYLKRFEAQPSPFPQVEVPNATVN